MMSELPIEIWQNIMRRLPAQDLVACSEVCKYWRNVIDSDILWRPLCLEKRWTKIHRNLSTDDSGVFDVCQWRRIYDSNEELYCKWKSRKWTRHSLAAKGHQGQVFSLSSDSRLLVVGYRDGTVIVWDIGSEPRIEATMECLLPNYPVSEVKVAAGRVAALQDRLVQVFRLGPPALSRVFSLDLGPGYSDLTSSWTSLPYFQSWYRECLRVNDVKTSKRLITALGNSHLVVSTGEGGSVYAWPLDTDGLAKNFVVQGKVKQLITWEDSVYIVGWDRRSTKISEYLGNEGCLDQVVESPDNCKAVLSEKYVVTVPAEGGFTLHKLRVWSRKTGRCIGVQIITSATTHACVTDNDMIVFSEENTVVIWDPQKDSILRRIAFLKPNGILPVNYVEARFCDLLVVMLDNAVCVYDWVKGTRLYSITAQLEWSEDYINLIWTSPTALVLGGIYNQPELLSFV